MPAGDTPYKAHSAILTGQSDASEELLGATTEGSLSVSNHAGITSQYDDTANDSDKSFTVPAGRIWEMLCIYVSLITTATAGTRYIWIHFRNTADQIIGFSGSPTSQNPSVSGFYCAGVGYGRALAVTSNIRHMPMPGSLWLPAGYDIRVRDSNAVDAAADDMTVGLLYRELTL